MECFSTKDSIELSTAISIDRDDISFVSPSDYPGSYHDFRCAIEDVFFKSELLLKCKIKFEQLMQIDLFDTTKPPEGLAEDVKLNMVFTGATKSGKSSLINLILNTKVLPTCIIGNGCCIEISHPKNENRQISMGVHEWSGWEISKLSNLNIDDLSQKVEEVQSTLIEERMDKGQRLKKRLCIELPHWFLKNISIFKCSPIDGMYSFDEPFDIIENSKNSILIHVIDATNGLMQWDRTFLARILHKKPKLPIFFVINHVDIRPEIAIRDNYFARLESSVEGGKFDSDSDFGDDGSSDKTTLSDDNFLKKQERFIQTTKNHIVNLGFSLETNLIVSFGCFSAKEFMRMIKKDEDVSEFHKSMMDNFFKTFNIFLNLWFEKLLITSSLQLKSRINGLLDATISEILHPVSAQIDSNGDIYMSTIEKLEKNLSESLNNVINDFEKCLQKSVKDELKGHENVILSSLPQLQTDEMSKAIHIMKPKLQESCEKVLLRNNSNYNLNEEIKKLTRRGIEKLGNDIAGFRMSGKFITFIEYMIILYRVLKKTIHFPYITTLTEEFFSGNPKKYLEFLRSAQRRILGTNLQPQDIVQQTMETITVLPLIQSSITSFQSILGCMQEFSKRYQENYRMTKSLGLSTKIKSNRNIMRTLILLDFVIQVMEKSFQNDKLHCRIESLQRTNNFHSDVFQFGDAELMYRRVNIQSFSRLEDLNDGLCFKRMRLERKLILQHKTSELFHNGLCILGYEKMDYDLYKAIEFQTRWSEEDILGIMKQLLEVIRHLSRVATIVAIRFYPTNILLRQTETHMHKCSYFRIQEIKCPIKPHWKSKYTKFAPSAAYQLGLVLSWILSNDTDVTQYLCTEGRTESCQDEYAKRVCKKMGNSLHQNLLDVCLKFVFSAESYTKLDLITREFDKCQMTCAFTTQSNL